MNQKDDLNKLLFLDKDVKNLDDHLLLDELLTKNSEPVLSDDEWNSSLEGFTSNNVLDNGEWNDLFESSWKKADNTKVKIYSFRKPLYAIAASLLIFFGLYMAYSSNTLDNSQQLAEVQEINNLSEISQPYVLSKQITISKKCKMVVSERVKYKILQNQKDKALIELSEGSLLVHVKKNSYNSFQINTPDAQIIVTGTVFNTTFKDNITSVSVIRGSVIVLYKDSNRKIVLNKNQKSEFLSGKIVVSKLEDSEVAVLASFDLKFDKKVDRTKKIIPIIKSIDYSKELDVALKELKNGNIQKALTIFESIKNGATTGSALQTSWFKGALIKLDDKHKTTIGVLELKEYLNRFGRKGIYFEEVLVQLVSYYKSIFDNENLLLFERKYLNFCVTGVYAKDYLYDVATILRSSKLDFTEASIYYELFVEKFKKDLRHEDALFWVAKCHYEENNEVEFNKYANQYKKEYPSGKWNSQILLLQK